MTLSLRRINIIRVFVIRLSLYKSTGNNNYVMPELEWALSSDRALAGILSNHGHRVPAYRTRTVQYTDR